MKYCRHSAFTLLELLIYMGIFIIVAGATGGILFGILRIQNNQTSASVVSEESRFVLQRIQQAVRDSSLIDIASGVSTSTLILRTSSSSDDLLTFYASGSLLYVREEQTSLSGNTTIIDQPLTDSRVEVSGLSFTKIANPNSRDGVQVSFTMSYVTNGNDQLAFSKLFRDTIARVNAAVFDSDIIPAQDNVYSVGLSSPARWRDINISNILNLGQLSGDPIGGQNGSIYYNTASGTFRGYASGTWSNIGNQWGVNGTSIYYNTGNVGIGSSSPGTALAVNGTGTLSGLRVNGSGIFSTLTVNGTGTMNGLKIPTGASNGHVLTSDASGNATWSASVSAGNHSTSSRSFDFPTISSDNCVTTSTIVIGAATGDVVVGTPVPASNGVEDFAVLIWQTYVSAPGIVDLRVCSVGSNSPNPSAQTWYFDAWH